MVKMYWAMGLAVAGGAGIIGAALRLGNYTMISLFGRLQSGCLRQVPGDVPNWRLNARLNAASDS